MKILEIITLIFPGMIAAKFEKAIKKVTFIWSDFILNSIMYIFFINCTNLFLIHIRGWNTINFNYSITLLLKYMLCSLFFSILYPNIFCNKIRIFNVIQIRFKCVIKLLSKVNNLIKNKIKYVAILLTILVSWIMTIIITKTILRPYLSTKIFNYYISFIIIFILICIFSLSILNLGKKIFINKNKIIVKNLCIILLFILSFWSIILFAILKHKAKIPTLTTNVINDFICILFINITICLLIFCTIGFIKNSNSKVYLILQNIYFIAFPILLFIMLDGLINSNAYSQFINVLGNLLIYYSLLFFLLAIIKNKKVALLFLVTFCYVLGVVDHFVYKFKGSPITIADIWSLRTALSVSSGFVYNLSVNFITITTLFIMNIIIICILFEKGSYKFQFKNYLKNLISFLLATCFCLLLLRNDAFSFDVNKWDPITTYQTKGTALSLLNDMVDSIVQKPDGYSFDKVKSITNRKDLNQISSVSEYSQPNIIVIMNEAFSDLSIARELSTSEDYMPFIHSLTEDTIKGDLLVSIHGGLTCNTEFEFLTGNSMAFLPKGSIPYQQYITKKMDSMSTVLKNQNYSTTAIHPYGKYNWGRSRVYPLLGFDIFYSMDDFENPKLLRGGYISDEESFYKINEVITNNSNLPNYIFNVTMQNHGGYADKAELDNWIHLTDRTIYFPEMEEYFTLVHATDAAFKDLISFYKNSEKPTIILMFGDHQPAFDQETMDYLYDDIENAPLAEQQKKYMVPFIIWANYDIKEKDNEIISPNYLSSYLLNVANVRMTPYNKYLLALQEKIPAINAFGYLGDDGNWYDFDQKTSYTEDILDYEYIQYNNIFDRKNRNKEFFKIAE